MSAPTTGAPDRSLIPLGRMPDPSRSRAFPHWDLPLIPWSRWSEETANWHNSQTCMARIVTRPFRRPGGTDPGLGSCVPGKSGAGPKCSCGEGIVDYEFDVWLSPISNVAKVLAYPCGAWRLTRTVSFNVDHWKEDARAPTQSRCHGSEPILNMCGFENLRICDKERFSAEISG